MKLSLIKGGALTLLAALLLTACGATPAGPGRLAIVAAENFWGSITGQLGGDRVDVASIVTDPNADPHEYESNSDDARAFADAAYVVLNGAGYDAWAQKLLDASPSSARRVLVVAGMLGKREGDNPHFWYSPSYVERVADHITADLKAIDPAGASYYTQQRAAFENALGAYHHEISTINARSHGVRVASTESIFVYLAQALGLVVVSPPEFMNAVAEGNDPPVSSVTEFEDQLQGGGVAVLVFNEQTVTPLTTTVQQIARAHGIPVVGITETIQPVTRSFEAWQAAQLQSLMTALSAHRSP